MAVAEVVVAVVVVEAAAVLDVQVASVVLVASASLSKGIYTNTKEIMCLFLTRLRHKFSSQGFIRMIRRI